jgi:hypothetical protein
MHTVIRLRARGPRNILPALIAALVLGGAIAACCLAIVFGAGVEPEPSWNPVLLVITIAALAPTAFFVRRLLMVWPPAQLVLDRDSLTIAYPELLRTPFAVPRSLLRFAAIEDEGPYRFRVHTQSGPYWGGDDDGFIWVRGSSALPILAPDWAKPNLLLLFETPVAGAEVRRSRMGAIYAGEHVAGLLLAARDPFAAQQALTPLGLTRPLTMPDVIRLEEQLEAGGRDRLGLRHLVRVLWAWVAIGAVVPICAAVAGVGGLVVWLAGKRAQGITLAIVGMGVFGVRMALWLG